MILVFHGGKCCGVKTIHKLPSRPRTTMLSALKSEAYIKHDKLGLDVSSDLSFFTNEAPKETALERFRRLIDFCRNERPYGLIEVTTASFPVDYGFYGTTDEWKDILIDEGFRDVSTFYNSNSGRNVTVWHFTYDAKTVSPRQKKSPAAKKTAKAVKAAPWVTL